MESKILNLLQKPVCMMSGEEYLELTKYALAVISPAQQAPTLAKGIRPLSEELGCSVSQLYTLKKQGVLDDAVVSRIGKKVVFDVEKARTLADAFQREYREKKARQYDEP